ncbi:MAG: hypothetical protein HP491_07030 [Nitrospira sp.]|nr:hypothetical protein [Nitrospira sp.]
MRKFLPHTSGIVRLRVAPPALLTLLAVLGVLATGCVPQQPHVVGLRPESPSIEKETHIDTLRPTFRWERFPQLRHPFHQSFKAVTYELRLWKVGKEFSGAPQKSGPWIGTRHDDYKYSWMYGCRDTDPGELVYSRQGIGQPEHTLETTLQPDSRYFGAFEPISRSPTDGGRRNGVSSCPTTRLSRKFSRHVSFQQPFI